MAERSRKHETAVREEPTEARRLPGVPERDLLPILTIIAAWVMVGLLVDPRGEFPLNDDWAYAKSVLVLLKEHKLRFLGIVPMTLVAQVVWGALFCSVSGFSFTALRISTLVLGLVGLLVLYKLLAEIRVSKWVAVIGCFVVALNPLYLCLSYTFMTDVPFAVVVLAAVYAYMLAVKRDSTCMISVGTVLACAATLIRQTGIVLPMAFALGYLVAHGVSVRTLIRSAAPVVIVVGTLIGYDKIMRAAGLLPAFYGYQIELVRSGLACGFGKLLMAFLHTFRSVCMYLGLFLFPFLVMALPRAWSTVNPRLRLVNLSIAAAVFIAVVAGMLLQNVWMPINHDRGDIIYDLGIGPATLQDVFLLRLPALPNAPESFWVMVSIVGAVGEAMLVWYILLAMEVIACKRISHVSREDRGVTALLLGCSLLYMAPLVALSVQRGYLDRYLLPEVPLLMAMVALLSGPMLRPTLRGGAVAIILTVLIGAFSIGGTHDYLEWNRTRWKALESLTVTDRIAPDMIDGGYEFNGWYNYRGLKQHYWRAIYGDFVVAFGPVAGYEVLRDYTYRRWMPPDEGHIYVLYQVAQPSSQ